MSAVDDKQGIELILEISNFVKKIFPFFINNSNVDICNFLKEKGERKNFVSCFANLIEISLKHSVKILELNETVNGDLTTQIQLITNVRVIYNLLESNEVDLESFSKILNENLNKIIKIGEKQ